MSDFVWDHGYNLVPSNIRTHMLRKKYDSHINDMLITTYNTCRGCDIDLP